MVPGATGGGEETSADRGGKFSLGSEEPRLLWISHNEPPRTDYYLRSAPPQNSGPASKSGQELHQMRKREKHGLHVRAPSEAKSRQGGSNLSDVDVC